MLPEEFAAPLLRSVLHFTASVVSKMKPLYTDTYKVSHAEERT